MAINIWEIGIIVILLFIGIAVIVTFVYAKRYNKDLSTRTVTRGLNGMEGKTINLQCPSGQKINIYKANYICSSGTSIENPVCDPFWKSSGQNTTFFNPSTTLDKKTEIANNCNGKEQCTWQIPFGTTINICGTASAPNSQICSGKLQLVGTYDCVSE